MYQAVEAGPLAYSPYCWLELHYFPNVCNYKKFHTSFNGGLGLLILLSDT